MCGRKTSSNAARSSLFCTIGTGVCCWPDNRSGPSGRSFNTAFLSSVHRKSARCTDRGFVKSVAPRFLNALSSLYDDLSHHLRMQPAEVAERAGTGERVGIRVVRIEWLRPEGLVIFDHGVGNVVVIDELDRRSHRDRQFPRPEREVVDRDNIRILRVFLCRERTERHHRSDDGAQQHGNHQGAAGDKSSRCGAQMAIQIFHVQISDQPASVLSTKASGLLPCSTVTVESPSMDRSWSEGTTIGPGEGALPGAGCGKAVDSAVWKVMLPSTFCAS